MGVTYCAYYTITLNYLSFFFSIWVYFESRRQDLTNDMSQLFSFTFISIQALPFNASIRYLEFGVKDHGYTSSWGFGYLDMYDETARARIFFSFRQSKHMEHFQ